MGWGLVSAARKTGAPFSARAFRQMQKPRFARQPSPANAKQLILPGGLPLGPPASPVAPLPQESLLTDVLLTTPPLAPDAFGRALIWCDGNL